MHKKSAPPCIVPSTPESVPPASVHPRATRTNVARVVQLSRITGRCPHSFGALRATVPSVAQAVNTAPASSTFPAAIEALNTAFARRDTAQVAIALAALQRLLGIGPSGPLGATSGAVSAFVAWGGADAILKVFHSAEEAEAPEWLAPVTGPKAAIGIWNAALRILTELAVTDPRLVWYMVERCPQVAWRAFHLIGFKPAFENAASFCEQVLAVVGPVLDLSYAKPALQALLRNASDPHLAILSRVLALLSNTGWNVPLPTDSKCNLAPFYRRQEKCEAFVLRNHDLLLEMPNLLGRLIGLLKYQVHALTSTQQGRGYALTAPHTEPAVPERPPSPVRSLTSSLFSLLDAIGSAATSPRASSAPVVSAGTVADEYMAGVPLTMDADAEIAASGLGVPWFYTPTPDLCTDTTLRLLQLQPPSGPDSPANALTDARAIGGRDSQALAVVSCQSEVLFVLSSLVVGYRCHDVWTRLSGSDLQQTLLAVFSSVFPARDAGAELPEEESMPPGQEHDHDPETLRKMEFLRLIYGFWDSRHIYDMHQPFSADVQQRRRKLLHLLCDIARREPREHSCTYNLLMYCLEAYVRGTPFQQRAAEQRVVADLIMPHILASVAACRCESTLESEFHVLAELVKFNPSVFADHLAKPLMNPQLSQGLTAVVSACSVQANLFMRAVMLTAAAIDRTSEGMFVDPARCKQCSGRCKKGRPNFWEPFSAFLERVQHARDLVNATKHGEARGKPTFEGLVSRCRCETSGRTHQYVREGGIAFNEPLAGADHVHDQCNKMPKEPVAAPLNPAISRFLRDFMSQQRAQFLRNIMVEVSLNQLDRECLCRTSSALAFFVVAHRNSQLLVLLKQIQDMELAEAAEHSNSADGPGLYGQPEGGRTDPFWNFYELLCLWAAHYLPNEHFQDALFYGSRLPVNLWKETALKLLEVLPHYFLIPVSLRLHGSSPLPTPVPLRTNQRR